ncbi:hypothetical protein, no similarity [Maudiozyma saulgeensis]|uniref:Uncharacterized protein n=1 Tax=Maudiozyma saulgeensis TaxID=1789683 RepID=A0A1X7RAY0_9SACH|nr:hypothetical protein, no similarity [Kazachstania saulgeensis]
MKISSVLLSSILVFSTANAASSSSSWSYTHASNHAALASSYWAAHSTDSSVAAKHSQYESWASASSVSASSASSASSVASRSSASANEGFKRDNLQGTMMFTIAGAIFMLM